MSIINPITSNLSKVYQKCIVKPLVNFSESNSMTRVYNGYKNNNRALIDGIGIASIVLKDGVGCWMYVTQSLNNKDIPEDKRKFVAALDLTNGGLMIAAQILMHMTISNKLIQSKMFNKFFGKKFDRNSTKMIQAILKHTDKYKHISQHSIKEAIAKNKQDARDAFATLTSLFAATTIGKRIIVPFIATPLAGKVQKQMNKNNSDNQVHKDTINTYNDSKQIKRDNNKNTENREALVLQAQLHPTNFLK